MEEIKDGHAAIRPDGVVLDMQDHQRAPKKKAKTREEELRDLKKEVEMDEHKVDVEALCRRYTTDITKVKRKCFGG
jgi:hypothetical protein